MTQPNTYTAKEHEQALALPNDILYNVWLDNVELLGHARAMQAAWDYHEYLSAE